ncbi:MAG: beta-ketoacyl synthase N-terminal-like domain-containing protein [Gammaproteobacteria bacterium]
MNMNEQQSTENELEPIAIVSMACRFPKADDIEAFWRLLSQGEEGIRFFTDEELLAAGVEPSQLAQPGYVKAKGMIEGIEDFDAHLFAYTPREAELMDPQQRVLLECAWQLLESAALDPDRYQGDIAAYVGVGMNIYLLNNLLAQHSLKESADFYQMLIGSDKDFAATRLAYKLNLKGPAVAMNTACSTSLVAVHYACQSLWDYQCDVALAGGATLLVPQKAGYLYQQGGIPSPDGHCRAFDAQAGGTVPASGAGLVLLKRLEDAIQDNDTIYAVIKGSAVNNDGADKIGFTAPSVNGQAAVIAEALAVANVSADSIDYIEAHGTATPLGDPIEIAALKLAFAGAQDKQYCALGSVKTNLGHMDTAAGIAGLIKTALALHHRQIPASLHFSEANPDIEFKQSPFYVNRQLQNWPQTETPRRAGVSSFGIGGTNAHVVLEQAPDKANSGPSVRQQQLLPLSAKTPEALKQLALSLAGFLQSHAEQNLADLAYSLAVGRRELPVRGFVLADSRQQAVQSLSDLSNVISTGKPPAVVFMFPGQGTQKTGMGQWLYRTEAVFKQQVDFCCDYLEPLLGLDLRQLMYPEQGRQQEAEQQLNKTQNTQPALFVFEYALARQLMAWQIKPAAMIGHSLGEYVAACIADVFSLEDALKLVVQRSRLMQAAPSGGMLAVMATQAQCQPWLSEELALAAVNAECQCVLSGSRQAIDALLPQLKDSGIIYRQLTVAHGFHSPLMKSAAEAFAESFKSLDMKPNAIPYVSNLTGDWFDSAALSAAYWQEHMLQPVRFAQGLETLCAEFEALILLEVGPGNTLQALAKSTLKEGQRSLGTLNDEEGLQSAVAQLWSAGVHVDWNSFYRDEQRQRMALPTYPFQRQRCWVEPEAIASCQSVAKDDASDLAQWFATVNWQRCLVLPPIDAQPADFRIALVDEAVADFQMGAGLWRQVTMASSYQRLNEYLFSLNPEQEQDFERFISDLSLTGKQAVELLYCWNSVTGTLTDSYALPYLGLMNFCKVLNRVAAQTQCRITVITQGLFEVTGGESGLSPLQALLLGPVKVVPQEFSQIQCRLIDIEAGQSALPDFSAVSYGDPVLAWRHGYYWRPDLENLNLPEITRNRDLLKQRGNYLITGGLGGIGLSLAGFLARKYQGRLVLTTHQDFPDKSTWQTCLGSDSQDDFNELLTDLVRTEKKLIAELAIPGLDSFPGLQNQLEQLCSLHLLRFFEQSGIQPYGDKQWTVNEAGEKLKLLAKFDKFLRLLLEIVQRDNLISWQGEQFSFSSANGRDWDVEISQLERQINRHHPGFTPLHEMVAYCVAHFGAALSGEIEAISVLYPDGDRSLISETGEKTIEHSNHRVYYQLLKHLVHQTIDRSDEVVRILEVGGGSGVLTGIIAPTLQGKKVEYYFTDIGKSFVLKVQQQAQKQGLDFMRFSVFDIFQDPVAQGFDLQSFDLIYGLDVVHATPDINKAVSQLSRLLKPGGDLCLVETPPIPRWYEMVWGLAEGWWYFNDTELRSGTTPLLSPDTWQQVMTGSGLFAKVAVFPPEPEQRLTTDCCLVVARAPGQKRAGSGRSNTRARQQTETIRMLLDMERAGAEVMVCTADVCDAMAMQKALDQAVAEYGGLNGVFHTAASDSRGYIDLQDKSRSLAELQPKVLGTQVLQQCMDFNSLDFVLLFSSLNAITGGQGNIAYTAANSFLDAFAHYCRHHQLGRVYTLDWDRWQSLGQAVAFEQRMANSTGVELKGGISDAEGFEAIRRALASGYSQLLVKTGRTHDLQTGGSVEAVPEIRQSGHQRPHLAQQYAAPETPMQQLIAGVWSEVLGIDRPGIEDEFAALGGDSLIAIRVISRLKELLNMNLEVKLIFEYNTIARLARQIEMVQSVLQVSMADEDDETEYEGGVI